MLSLESDDSSSGFDGHILGFAHHRHLPIPPVPPPIPLPAHGILPVWNGAERLVICARSRGPAIDQGFPYACAGAISHPLELCGEIIRSLARDPGLNILTSLKTRYHTLAPRPTMVQLSQETPSCGYIMTLTV